MWVAKIKMDGGKALLGGLCKKHRISASAFPISTRIKEKRIIVYFTLFIFGNDEDKINFLRDLKSNERIVGMENNGDFIVGQLIDNIIFEPMYKYNIINFEPIKFDEEGYEIWTVASWNKEDLMDFADGLEKTFDVEILRLSQEKVSNISILTLQPELTPKQKVAMEFAIKYGYYEHPRKTELKKLAKQMGVSFSTYQAHLRKAERKLLPFFFEKS